MRKSNKKEPKRSNGKNANNSQNPVGSTSLTKQLAQTSVVKNSATAPHKKKQIALQPTASPQQLGAYDLSGPAKNSPYVISTGLQQESPVIVASSEFVPLYDLSGEMSPQGKTLSLKYNSSIQTSKVASTFLTQSESAKKAADDNKENVKGYLTSETQLLSQFYQKTQELYDTLCLAGHQEVFKDFLKDCGYDNSKTAYSNTKLWQQSLVELKKALLTYSPQFLSDGPRKNQKNDEDPYLLSDVDTKPQKKHLWLNPYYALPSSNSFLSADNLNDVVQSLKDFRSNVLINLWSPESIATSSNLDDEKSMSLISNCVTKETLYSRGLVNGSGFLRLNGFLDERGYGVTAGNVPNFTMWDNIIGKFSVSVSDPPPVNSIGNGKSLVSYSKRTVTESGVAYDLLTFEEDYLPGNNSTPGIVYYVDGTISIGADDKFNEARLNSLRELSVGVMKTIENLIKTMGFSIKQVDGKEVIEIDQDVIRYDVRHIKEKLTPLIDAYSKRLLGKYPNASQKEVATNADDAEQQVIDKMRASAVVLKAAIDPASEYKSYPLLGLLFFAFLHSCMGGTNADDVMSTVGNFVMGMKSNNKNYDDSILMSTSYQTDVAKKAIDEFENSLKKELSVLEALLKNAEKALQEAQKNWDELYAKGLVHMKTSASEAYGTDQAVDIQKKAVAYYTKLVSDFKADMPKKLQQFIDNFGESVTKNIVDQFSSYTKMNQGLFLIVKNLLLTFMNDNGIFLNGTSRYSSQNNVGLLFTYFILILKVIASITPETLAGVSVNSYYQSSDYTNVAETYLDIQQVPIEQLSEYYEALIDSDVFQGTLDDLSVSPDVPAGLVLKDIPVKSYVFSEKNVVEQSIKLLDQEFDRLIDSMNVFRGYILNLISKIDDFTKFIKGDFQNYLSAVKSAYAQDSTLTDSQKINLLNLSLAGEQIKMTNYVMSEVSDRISQESQIKSSLMTLPAFKNFPGEFEKFLSTNGIDLIAYHMLSPYFRSSQFLSNKSVNKRIFSVGIPHGLLRKLRAYRIGNPNDRSQKIINLKIYKNDILRPNLIFKPMSYLFETSRFPTRVIGNWDFESFSTDTFNPLTVPTKYVNVNGVIEVHRNFSDVSLTNYSTLSSDPVIQQSVIAQVYGNHAISFLLEEYLRWFTDCRFEESSYHSYVGLTKSSNSASQTASTGALLPNDANLGVSSNATAVFTDPSTGLTYNVPVKKSNVSQVHESSTKSYEIPVNDTLRSFFKDETFLTDPQVIKRRIVYPKKFERVFNVVVDPDDFVVDETLTPKSVIDGLVDKGFIQQTEIEIGSSGGTTVEYRSRDTTDDDTTFCEYFFTVEPHEQQLNN